MMPHSPRPRPSFPNPKIAPWGEFYRCRRPLPRAIHGSNQRGEDGRVLFYLSNKAAHGCFLALFHQHEHRPRESAAPQSASADGRRRIEAPAPNGRQEEVAGIIPVHAQYRRGEPVWGGGRRDNRRRRQPPPRR
jgi:hypothetical protein